MHHDSAFVCRVHGKWIVGLLGSLLFIGCSEDNSGGPGAGGTTASSGVGGGGASQTGGTVGSGGSAGRAGAPGTSGASTAGSGQLGGQAGRAGSGGVPSGGTSGGAGATAGGDAGSGGVAGASAGTAGTVGTAGTGVGTAGTSGEAGSGGDGGTGGATDDDRCDIAKHDPQNPPKALTLSGALGTHDPVVMFAHGQYYRFQTGKGIPTNTSANLTEWKAGTAVFSSNPSWIAQQVPEARDLWAPDISYFGGSYHLYYSASSFGKNRSCIGHATRAALNAGSFTDKGAVICSNPDGGKTDDWNAIDPNVVVDEEGTPWLSFGSFWGGLKMIRLDQTGARADNTLHSIAARPDAAGALEAPFIVRRCGFYYLFVSFDKCCSGVDSTYKVMVGRSTNVRGPYVDKAGKAMMEGGGTLVLQGNTRWKGPGHNAVIFTDDAAYNVYHSYDANANGAATLRISELVWDESGWPISGGP